MDQFFSLLLIAPDALCSRLSRILADENVTLQCCSSVEDGFIHLQENNAYQALILGYSIQSSLDVLSDGLYELGEQLPLVYYLDDDSENDLSSSVLLKLGFFDVLHTPLTKEQVTSFLLRLKHRYENEERFTGMLKNMEFSEAKLLEKNTILQTSLDILSHDTRNTFIRINSLISQLDQSPIQSMLKDCVDELFEGMKEASGFLDEHKRIICLSDYISNLKITKERIVLATHPRIRMRCDHSSLLYVETSSLIKNAVANLVDNALKYSSEDAIVDVEVLREPDLITVNVRDRGKGIPDKEKKRIFERKYRREETVNVDGSGRGLWITRNIVQKAGGRVSVGDNPGGGSLFTVSLSPFKIADLHEAKSRLTQWFNLNPDSLERKISSVRTLIELNDMETFNDENTVVFTILLDHLRRENREKQDKEFMKKLVQFKSINKETRQILICDDSIHVHYYLGSLLTELGYGIADYARNGEEAVQYYTTLQPDLVTLDHTMPLLSGTEAGTLIYEQNPDARILYITGLGDDPVLRENLSQKFKHRNFRILAKPFRKSDLEHIIKEMLEQPVSAG